LAHQKTRPEIIAEQDTIVEAKWNYDYDLIPPRIVWVERDGVNLSVDRAMVQFLRAIKSIAPEVLSDLARTALPLYQSIYVSGTAFERDHLLTHFAREVMYGVALARMPIAMMPDELIMDQPDFSDSFRLRLAVWRWAKQFRLDGVILAYAAQTLRLWCETEAAEDLGAESLLILAVLLLALRYKA